MGSAETIARKIMEVQEQTPLDGMLFTFPEFVQGMSFFGERVMPILRDMGLRRTAWGDRLRRPCSPSIPAQPVRRSFA